MKQIALAFSLLFLIFVHSSAEYNPSVRIDPALDRFFHRMQTRYGFYPHDPGIQPFGTKVLSEALDSLYNSRSLSPRERYELLRLQERLSPFHGFSYQSEEKDLHINFNLNLLGDVEGSLNDDAIGGRGIINPRLSGNVGILSFYSEVDVWTEYRSDTLFGPSTYQPYDGIPYNLYGRNTEEANLRSSDLPRGGINISLNRIDLALAIDYLKLGPAQFYPNTLSGLAPPITYAKAELDMGPVRYYHLAGLLQSQRDKRKYIYAHRLSGRWRALHVGLNEIIINGSTTDQQGPNDPHNSLRDAYYKEERQERQLEIAYLIPFVPFVIVEHYLGDRDNAAISLDFSLTWPENFLFYGEFHIDDILSPWQIFSDDWGNKWAITAGMAWYGTLFGKDFSSGIEYSRVEPWVYTHFYGGSHRFDHFDQPLGSPFGPNSRAVLAYADLGISNRNSVGIRLSSIERNPHTRGGSIDHVFQDDVPGNEFPDSNTKEFLKSEGKIHHLRPGIYWNFDPFGLFRVDALYEIDLKEDRGRSRLSLYGGFYF
ncbi:hypothetical protein CHISP_0028 [Chitinispirillum alkaliphilum]|nr:hypothetical protein CHISP_0028 [Chitinispirillum alkaliphilum]